MPLSTIFQLYRGGQFYWWKKLEYLQKINELQNTPFGMFDYIMKSVLTETKIGG
jgi:hypothetical protein